MPYIHADPRQADSPTALPDVEVFEIAPRDVADIHPGVGWYWWYCFPGCLPDSGAPHGPFRSYTAAVADVRSMLEDTDDTPENPEGPTPSWGIGRKTS